MRMWWTMRAALWISAHGALYRRWPDGSAARYTMRDGLPDFYPSDLLEDHEGRLWVGTRSGGFFRISADDSNRALVVDLRFTSPELPTAWVFQLFETSDRRFWVATNRGLVEFLGTGAEQGPRFRTYSERNSLSYFDITAVTEDLGGNLWLGTNTAGVMKLTRHGFGTYGAQDGIQVVTAIFEDRAGNICFRGTVLGDVRTSVFEGAKLDLLQSSAVCDAQSARLLQRPALRLVQARRHKHGLGPGADHAASPERRLVGRPAITLNIPIRPT